MYERVKTGTETLHLIFIKRENLGIAQLFTFIFLGSIGHYKNKCIYMKTM